VIAKYRRSFIFSKNGRYTCINSYIYIYDFNFFFGGVGHCTSFHVTIQLCVGNWKSALNNFFSHAKYFVYDSNENDIDLFPYYWFWWRNQSFLKTSIFMRVVDTCLIWTDIIILILRPVCWDKLYQSTQFKGKLHKLPINTHYIHSVVARDFVSGRACCVNQYHYESRCG
jgi:hypothetical protein